MTAPAAQIITLGFDVSAAQGPIDWTQLRGHERRFVWAKATEGAGYEDPTFARNVAGARAAGLVVGGYEFAHLDTSPEESAGHTCRVILTNGFGDADIPPALDVERVKGSPRGPAVADWCLRWLERVEALTGRRGVVYTGAGYWSAVGSPDSLELGAYPLWLAAYVTQPDHFVPLPWRARGWTVWQETGDQAPPGKPILHLPGVRGNVDSCQMRGTVADLIARSRVRQTAPDGALQLADTDRAPAHAIGVADRAEDEAHALAELYTLDSDEPDTTPQTPTSKSTPRFVAVRPPPPGSDPDATWPADGTEPPKGAA